MNRERSIPPQPSSGLGFETRRLANLLDRWATYELNQFFDLSSHGARRRVFQAAVFAVMFWAAAVGAHVWLERAHPFLPGDGPRLSALTSQAPLYAVRIMLIMGIALSMAVRAAGQFLAHVFQLRDESLGWTFVGGVAAGSTRETLHLREGKIVDSERNSLMVLIGGPGRVQADSDSAAVFERADGMSRVVGPWEPNSRNSDDTNSGTVVDGFERIREPVVDLRDQYIGSAGAEPMTVVGRSLDGVPVSVIDVRAVFSVRRDPTAAQSASSIRLAYPLRPQDLENLIYRQAVPVVTNGEHPSGIPAEWAASMQALIRSSLRQFMSQNRLTDFLAGVGAQEVEATEYREDTILAKSLQISSDVVGAGAPRAATQASMRPRTDLSAKFKKYGSEFSTRAQQLGLELHWIGVGTWKIPEDASGAAVNEKHLQAWQMNRENAERSEPPALERVTEDALLDGKLQLIQEVPISSHQENQKHYSDRAVLTECLLQDLWGQLGNALDVYYRNDIRSPEVQHLERALLKVEDLLGIQQEQDLLGTGPASRVRTRPPAPGKEEGPPAPASRTEATRYQVLLGKLDGSYKVAEAMIANEARRHGNLNREELIARIVQRFERHGR